MFKLHAAYEYTVQFIGVEEDETIDLLKSASMLIKLEETPPATLAALKHRAEADIPNFIKVMHSLAYYNAFIDLDVQDTEKPVLVQFKIVKGTQYLLKDFKLIAQEDDTCPYPFDEICLSDIGITLDCPAYPKSIIEAQDTLIELMEEKGYPLANIVDRKVYADVQSTTISVVITVKSGPFCYFGKTYIKGQCLVKDILFRKKIYWKEGHAYNPCLIEKTHTALESTGLFSSISIVHREEAQDGFLPMEIQVTEGKHHSIAAGVSYSSDIGPGVLAEWENRNFRGAGEKLSFKANIAALEKEGTLLYLIPDFRRKRQDLLFLAEAQHEKTKGFTAASLSLSTIIERQINDSTRISYGLMLKQLKDKHSDNNRDFNIFKIPAQLRWSDANNILDPSFGQMISLKTVPSFQTLTPRFAYCINTLSTAIYRPLTRNHHWVFAAKATLGAIIGTTRHAIPPSERFYAGSDNLLRGYKYLTVSPIGHDHKPTGGRSMMIYSLEIRKRSNDSLGWVGFFDVGTVTKGTLPNLYGQFLKSAGVGIRYATPVGPLRFDIAFPLNPRKHIDNRFQIYVSIGQAF